MKLWPNGDVNAELPNDDPPMKEDITSCSTLLSKGGIASVENRILSCLNQPRQKCGFHQKYIEMVERN